MSDCCHEPNCRRSQPILIRRDPFTGRWLAITRWRRAPNESAPVRIYAIDKHEIVIDLEPAQLPRPRRDGVMTECNGLCVHASELIDCAPDIIAYPHDQCPLHGIGYLERPTPTEWNRDAHETECHGLIRAHGDDQ